MSKEQYLSKENC